MSILTPPLPPHHPIPTEAHTKRERRKDDRPQELLAAALDIFVEKGFAATRVEDIAHRAGVSKATLFLYFSAKEELFKEVVRSNISVRFTEWGEEFEHFEGTSCDMLHYCLNSWWQRIGSTKAAGIPKLIMSEARNFPELAAFYHQEVIAPGNALIGRILKRGMDCGEFRFLDLQYATYMVLSPMIFLVMWQHSLGPCTTSSTPLMPQQFLDMQLDILLHGFCTSPFSTHSTPPLTL